MSKTVTIGENTQISLGVAWVVGGAVLGGVIAFTIWLTTMHFDVEVLKKDMEQVKTEVHEVHQRVNLGKASIAAGDELNF